MMDGRPGLSLIKSLTTLVKEGVSDWEGCILSKEICVPPKLNSSAIQSRLAAIFADITDSENSPIQSYLWKAAHPKTSSVSSAQASIDHAVGPIKMSEYFDGSPLQLEDHLADFSLIESMGMACESMLLDQSYLVPDVTFTHLMTCLCTAITSHNFDEIYDWQALLKSVFPMAVLWKTLDIGHDHNGLILVESTSDALDKPTGFCIRRIKVLGQFPYNKWCGATSLHSPKHRLTPFEVSQHHLNTINFVKNRHFNQGICASTAVTMESYAQFERLQADVQSIKPDEISSSFAAVSVACNEAKEILGMNTKHMTEVKIHIAPGSGDKDSPTFAFYQDISTLKVFFNMLKDQSCEDGKCETSKQSEDIKKPAVKEIAAFLASYNQEWVNFRDSNTEDKKGPASGENCLIKQMVQERKELDFTERAWKVLKDMKSAEAVFASVDAILKEVAKGRNTQLWLHSNNKTTVAVIIRESYTGEVTNMPNVNEETALMLTIELGLDKLYRDYRNFFIGNCITVGSCLDGYKAEPSTFTSKDNRFCEYLKEQFIMLQKLHHVMEFVIQCKTLFSLSDEVIFTKAGSLLRNYMMQDLDLNRKFDFDVNFAEVKKMVVDRPPTLWKLILCSNEGKRKRSTCCTWMPDYPFKGIFSPPMNFNDSEEESQNSKVDDSLQYHVSLQTTLHLTLNPFASLSSNAFR